MITPWRVAFLAAVLGIGTALLVSMRAPPPPPEEPLPDAATASTPSQPPSPQQSLVDGPTSQPVVKLAAGVSHKTASGLTIIDVKEGSGLAAKAGDNVEAHYIGRLYFGGTQFDNSYDRGRPIQMALTDAGGIKGFVEGMIGMKVGGKRELILPPEVAYGARGVPRANIPPNATLVFDVELMSIQPN